MDRCMLDSKNIMDSIFEYTRVVDPIKKKVLETNNNLEYKSHECYSFWGNGEECKNCISMRAYNENKTISKIEFSKERIYLLMAVPMNKCVVEVFRDVTDDNLLNLLGPPSEENMDDKIKKLNELVIKDELTNVFNRRYINEKIPYEANKAIENSYNLYITMMDVDNFKAVNDTYGHVCGDYVLKQVVEIVNQSIGENDWVGRYGGDEFLIVSRSDEEDSYYENIEQIRKNIQEYKFKYKEYDLSITCSFGVFKISGEIDKFENIIESVDKKLLMSKGLNKNRVTI